MKKYLFEKAKFIKSATQAKDYPILRNLSGDIMPEIAVAGRSNVGKSSLLNNLFQSRHLVKTSTTPGKTQVINFFTLNHALGFVDLPGYGYAAVPMSVRKQWGPIVQAYFDGREMLKAVILLIDVRRIPNEEDLQMLEWVLHHGKKLILVITKIDKVNQSERALNTKKILEALNIGNESVIQYSTTKGIGRKKLVQMLQDILGE